jgi:hypothetical protein
MGDRVYKPGDKAPQSGVYRVVHKQHRPEHEVTLFRSEQFPRCNRCGDEVRFSLARIAQSIRDDEDFRVSKS